MEVIRDKDGRVIQRSRNLRGIHAYVGKHVIRVLSIEQTAQGEGKLMILFEDGASYETNFASYSVLREHVRNWRNVYGAPLMVNGDSAVGNVFAGNPALR